MEDMTGSGSPSSPSSPPPRHSQSRFQLSSSSQRRRRSWSPQSSSPSGGRRPRYRSWSPIVTQEEGAKALYMFFWYPVGPIAYGLYAINLPDPVLPLPPLQPYGQSSELNAAIYPILEFRKGDYPEVMCCVELESKLYFFGGLLQGVNGERESMVGDDGDFGFSFLPNVYVLNTDTLFTNADATSNQPSKLLSEGPAMNAGKPNPYAFVAYKKIYAIGASAWVNLPRFEVFDLDSNKWSILANPPVKVTMTGHALVDRTVFVVTAHGDLFSYGLDTGAWINYSRYCARRPPFDGTAKFIDDTLYAIYGDTLVAIGPTSASKPEFKRLTWLLDSSDVGDAIRKRIRPYRHASCLVHLRTSIFCYVLPVSHPDPENPEITHFTDDENLDISLITFEAMKDNYTKPSIEGVRTFFGAKLLHDAQYAVRSKCGAMVGSGLLLCCCLISRSAMA